MTDKFEIPESLLDVVRVLLGAASYRAVQEVAGDQAVKDLKVLYSALDNNLPEMNWDDYRDRQSHLTNTSPSGDMVRFASINEAYETGYAEGYEDGANDR